MQQDQINAPYFAYIVECQTSISFQLHHHVMNSHKTLIVSRLTTKEMLDWSGHAISAEMMHPSERCKNPQEECIWNFLSIAWDICHNSLTKKNVELALDVDTILSRIFSFLLLGWLQFKCFPLIESTWHFFRGCIIPDAGNARITSLEVENERGLELPLRGG